jgi:hypothetical protein
VLGSDDQELLGAFDAMEDVTGCALLVMMRSAAAFENALSALYAQHLMNGRDWTGLDFEPGTELKVRPGAALSDFEQRVRTIFAADGPPPRLSVERFSRHEPDPAGAGTLAREQFTIFVEAPPETALAFAEGSTVEPRTVRPVREAAVIFDETERTLDVVARGGGKTRRREIAEAFAETMLVPGAAFLNRARRALALDRLKVRPMFDVRPEDGVRSVEVTKLALGAPDLGAIASFEVPVRGEQPHRQDIYERASEVSELPNRPGWRVLSAKLRITFAPERRNARPKTVTFELKSPDRTNLRDQIELHRRIATTLLTRWGLYEAGR